MLDRRSDNWGDGGWFISHGLRLGSRYTFSACWLVAGNFESGCESFDTGFGLFFSNDRDGIGFSTFLFKVFEVGSFFKALFWLDADLLLPVGASALGWLLTGETVIEGITLDSDLELFNANQVAAHTTVTASVPSNHARRAWSCLRITLTFALPKIVWVTFALPMSVQLSALAGLLATEKLRSGISY